MSADPQAPAQAAEAPARAGPVAPPTLREQLAAMTPEQTAASYTAAKAFLYGEWFGASLACASFSLLYLFAFRAPQVPARLAMSVGLALLALGWFVFWRNRTYYERLGFPWARKWHVAAYVVAGAGAIFWLLLGLLVALQAAGIDVGPRE